MTRRTHTIHPSAAIRAAMRAAGAATVQDTTARPDWADSRRGADDRLGAANIMTAESENGISILANMKPIAIR